jgi:ankyrin repeat protein
MIACTTGAIEAYYELIEKQANIEAEDNSGWTPIHFASQNGKLDIIHELNKNNANINKPTKDFGKTALHLAIENKHFTTIKYLLTHDADVSLTTNQKKNCLHFAAESGCVEVMQELLTHLKQEVVDNPDELGWTSLHYASQKGHLDMVVLLHRLEASMSSTTTKKETALHLAAKQGHPNVAKFLLEKGCPPDVLTNIQLSESKKERKTALHLASMNQHFDTVNVLLPFSDKEVKDQDGKTALHLASERGFTAIVQLLVDAKSNVNSTSTDMKTSLHLAVLGNLIAIVDILAKPSDKEARNQDGKTALHLASERGFTQIVELLVGAGSDVNNITALTYQTALHLAAENKHHDTAVCLIQNRTDLTVKDINDKTTSDIAAENGLTSIVKEFIKNDSRLGMFAKEKALYLAAGNNCLETVKCLLKHADWTWKNLTDSATEMPLNNEAPSQPGTLLFKLVLDSRMFSNLYFIIFMITRNKTLIVFF